MIKQHLHTLAGAVMAAIPLFAGKGFTEAWADPATGLVLAQAADGVRAVLPADDLGSYFYLRTDKKVQMRREPVLDASGCVAAGYVLQIPVHLVAVSPDVCEDEMLDRLASALAYNGATLQSFSWNREEIIVRELAGAEDADLEAALQRADGLAIVSLSFILSVPLTLQPPNCFSTC